MKNFILVLFILLCSVIKNTATPLNDNPIENFYGDWQLVRTQRYSQDKIYITHVERQYIFKFKSDSIGINVAGNDEYNEFVWKINNDTLHLKYNSTANINGMISRHSNFIYKIYQKDDEHYMELTPLPYTFSYIFIKKEEKYEDNKQP